jgi:hypothetical protein
MPKSGERMSGGYRTVVVGTDGYQVMGSAPADVLIVHTS